MTSHSIFGRRNSKTRSARLSYPKNVLWECTRCAQCCGDVPNHKRQILLLPFEAYQISQKMNRVVQDFAEPAVESGTYTLKMRKKDNHCLFLNGNRCGIYEIRPLICRFYPTSLQQDGSNYIFEIAEECPGLGKGKCLDRNYYLSLLKLAQTNLGKL